MKKCTMLAIRKMMMALKEFVKKVFTRCKTIFNSLLSMFKSTNYKCTIKHMKDDGYFSNEELLDLRILIPNLDVDGFIDNLLRLSDSSIAIAPSEKYKKLSCIYISKNGKDLIKENAKTYEEKLISKIVYLYFIDV